MARPILDEREKSPFIGARSLSSRPNAVVKHATATAQGDVRAAASLQGYQAASHTGSCTAAKCDRQRPVGRESGRRGAGCAYWSRAARTAEQPPRVHAGHTSCRRAYTKGRDRHLMRNCFIGKEGESPENRPSKGCEVAADRRTLSGRRRSTRAPGPCGLTSSCTGLRTLSLARRSFHVVATKFKFSSLNLTRKILPGPGLGV